MQKQDEIPCANCQSWNRQQRKFSCNPHDCKQLTAWLFEHAPQISTGTTQIQAQLPEIAIQYVV